MNPTLTAEETHPRPDLIVGSIREKKFGRRAAITKVAEFLKLANDLAARGDFPKEQHEYFEGHQSRLTSTLSFFGLWNLTNVRILEVGPFFAYTPFFFRRQGNDVVVLDGTDPTIDPLMKLYYKEGIRCDRLNLAKVLTERGVNGGRLRYAADSFDCVLCFEAMEHFSFNPVFFVRELHRILRPNARAFITVPNQAKLVNRLRLLLGQPIRTPIEDYYRFADYNGGDFLGFHWREYLLEEVVELFSKSGFEVERAEHLNSFIDRPGCSLGRRLKRMVGRAAIGLIPSMGQNCMLVVRKGKHEPKSFALQGDESRGSLEAVEAV